VETQINSILQQGIISHSTSPMASPLSGGFKNSKGGGRHPIG